MARELFAQSAMEHAKPPTFLPGGDSAHGIVLLFAHHQLPIQA